MTNPFLASGLFIKLSKHLALLACFLILSRASGRLEVAQSSILLVAIAAACLQLTGRALQLRFAVKVFRSGFK